MSFQKPKLLRSHSIGSDNTHPTWWKDKGLRRMSLHILFLYFCIFTFGVRGPIRAATCGPAAHLTCSTMGRS